MVQSSAPAVDERIAQHPLISGSTTVGMLTAENPLFPVKTPGGNASLERELRAAGIKFEPTKGHYGAPENSYFVYGASLPHLFDIGHRYGQEAVIFSQGGRHQLVYTHGQNVGKANPSLPKYDYFPKEPPEDYYTKVPSTGGYIRLYFDHDNLQDTSLRPQVAHLAQPEHVVQAPADTSPSAPVTKHEIGHRLYLALKKSVDGAGVSPGHRWPGSYPKYDGHTQHHFVVRGPGGILIHTNQLNKADNDPLKHPHMDGPKDLPPSMQPAPSPAAQNDQAAGVGVGTYAKFAAPFGTINPGKKSDLFHYNYHGKLPQIQQLVKDHGFSTYYFGGNYGKPDLANRNYNTGHLAVYDPTPSSGGDFGDRDYTDGWRQIHELSHALVYPDLNKLYGEGRRIGKLGHHRTLNEALRAVHWEWLTVHKQRELSRKIGVEIPDDIFHRELNTTMHDAVHRAVTGKFTEPSDEGFVPHSHKVPLETSLNMVRNAAAELGLTGHHELLKKTILDSDRSTHMANNDIHAALHAVYTLAKSKVDAEAERFRKLRESEMSFEAMVKNEECAVCHKKGDLCKCMKTEIEKCGEKMEVKKEEKKPGKKPKIVLPGDKAPKDMTPKGHGNGGDLVKGDVPMASAPTKPPTASHPTSSPGAPKVGAQPPSAPMAKAQPTVRGFVHVPGRNGDMIDYTHGQLADGRFFIKEQHGDGKGAYHGDPLMHVFNSEQEQMSSPHGQALSSAHAKDGQKTPAALGKAALPGGAKPKLGGKDEASKMMTQHAASAAAPKPGAPAAPAAPAAPKLGADAQAARSAQFTDFTPAGAFQPAGASAAAGAIKPIAAPAGKPKHQLPGLKPVGTSAARPGLLDKFRQTLLGKSEEFGDCALCGHPEHVGPCEG